MPDLPEFEIYERTVRRIIETKILEEYPGVPVKVYHNKTFRGQSGHDHQIDVSVELMLAGFRILILAECKKYRASVGVDDVLVFLGRLRDIGAHKGLIVTTVGFQEGARRIAEKNGIALVLEEAKNSFVWDVVLPMLPPLLIAVASEPAAAENVANNRLKADSLQVGFTDLAFVLATTMLRHRIRTVAILEFVNVRPSGRITARVVQEYLISKVLNTGSLRVMRQESISKKLGGNSFYLREGGLAEAREAGTLLKVEGVVFGTYGEYLRDEGPNLEISLSASALAVADGSVIRSVVLDASY